VIAVQPGRILPEAQARRARAFVAGARPTVHARTAATVMLLRDTRRGLEVYVHLRHTAMAFAGGMIAFPGGCVDPGDRDPGSESADLPGWAEGLDTDPATSRAFVRAAIRETHEETGVRLDPADLVPWARWVSPRFEERRYDTWFFLAALPPGQEAADVSGEVEHVEWLPPATAIERAGAGELVMLPPTYAVLDELRGFATAAEALAAGVGRVIDTIQPGWVDDGEHVRVLLPSDPDYPGDDPGDLR